MSAYLFQNILFTSFYWLKVRFWLFLQVLTQRLPQSPPEGTGKTAVPSSPSQMEERAKNAIQRYGNAILRLGCSYLRNASDAEDILQESLLKLIYTAPEFCSEEHEKAWLFRVAINLCKNKIKYNRRREYEELSETLPYETPEDLSFVWEAVEALPIRYREVIHLFYQEGLSTAEIGKLLEKKESSIRSLLHRGRELLRSQLKEAYDFEE